MDFSEIFSLQNLIHLLDILVVWYVVYKIGKWVSGTRAMQLVRGVFMLIAIRIIAWWVGMDTVSWILDQIISWGPIALVVLFQQEIRRALEQLGNGFSVLKNTADTEPAELTVVNALDQALPYLSKRRIGALIAIEQKTSLQEIIKTGIEMDAKITPGIIINTFIPNTPLHDGAVIIRDDRVAAATAYLPLSENKNTSKDLGTRHRAALGLSETSDAVVIVVSEETGEVSIAYRGYLSRNLTPEEYDDYLRARLLHDTETTTTGIATWFTKKSDNKKTEGVNHQEVNNGK